MMELQLQRIVVKFAFINMIRLKRQLQRTNTAMIVVQLVGDD